MYGPVVRTVEVPCDQEMAFDVFINEMHTWWPMTRFSTSAKIGKTARELKIDAKVGGKIVEISEDASEHLWGTIRKYEPYGYLCMDFHIGLPKETASLVELHFTVLTPEKTKVELVQSNWESFGDHADAMYNGYGKGWPVIFEECYLAACSRKVA